VTDAAALISTDDLARRMGAPGLRIFDCTTYLRPRPEGGYNAESGRANYDKGHIPGAGFLDLGAELSDPHSKLRFTLPPLDELTKAFAAKGIGHGTFVVLYSHATPTWATRIWWMLRAIGFDDAAILDGGLDKWKAENRPLETELTIYPAATLSLRGRPEIFVDKNDIKAAIGKSDTLTLNALSHDQHKGAGGVVYGRPGRIAGSSCVPAASLFGADKTLKPIAELRQAFEGVGAAPDRRVLVYCGGGIAASLDAFVLTAILGHKNVAVYDNSMQEWSNDASLPMETG
jgi:thiosulfate/3-mercaptopyruvate sulfurtransferase